MESKVDVEAYITKYSARLFRGEAAAIRKNHEYYYDKVRFFKGEKEMPNECMVIYNNEYTTYNALVRMCPCKKCNCRNVYECEKAAHWCGDCRFTCQ